MPLPLIIGVVAVAAGLTGTGSVISGGVKIHYANKTAKEAKLRHNKNVSKIKAKEQDCDNAMDILGKTELEILESFDKFSELFARIKNTPEFGEKAVGEIKIEKFDNKKIKEVAVGAGTLLGGIGGAAAGTAGGFAAAGAAYSAVLAFGTASTGTAIGTLSGAAAESAALAAIGGGSIAAGGGGVALGTVLLGGATLGVGLLIGGTIFNITGSKISKKADEAWHQTIEAEKKTNEVFAKLDLMQTLAEKYTDSLMQIYKVYISKLTAMEQIVSVKTDWKTFDDEEKLLVQNTVLLVQLLYTMCKVKLIKTADDEDSALNTDEVIQSLDTAYAVSAENGFEYTDENFSVIVCPKWNSPAGCEKVFESVLPIDEEQAELLSKNMFEREGRNILIAQNVTKKRAEEIASQFSGTKSVGIIVTDDEIGSCIPYQELVS
ncbi:MAG: hypothetical protein J6I46_10745 [Ruminococcus sp.]|nr:hypothetical protein [Ruminococcus sp.]